MTVVVVAENEHELAHKATQVMKRRGESGDARAFLDGVRDRWLVGTVPQIAERLAGYAQVGVDRVIMKHVLHEDSDGLRRLGDGLLPSVGLL
jgi:alkanesulfonate monooxygenase SsuD/methylene tetrahydromethanopterin reductase-like flavin-dependent oxidoreductase (luciferase family)